MEGYGPNGMASYPPAPGAAFYGHQWGRPPPPGIGPSGNPYDYRPPPPERDPYRIEYWPREQYSNAPGPMRSHGPPPGRPSPYDRPNSWSGYPNRPPPPSGSSIPPPPPPPSNSRVPTAKSSSNFVFVRGLPPHVVEKDIDLFFHVKPTHIKLILDDFGRPSEAKVEFGSHEDAVKAMQQDKGMLFDRSVELFLCSKAIPSALEPSNGSNQPKDSDSRPLFAEPTKKEESPKETPSQVFGSNYSYSVSPANVSNGSAASTPTPTPTPSSKAATSPPPPPSAQQLSAEQQKSYSFYGMVPNGWQAEFTVPKSQPGAPPTATSTAGYNYAAYGNPYYPYGYNYGPYSAYYSAYGQPTTANPATPAAGTILKEPVNYSAR